MIDCEAITESSTKSGTTDRVVPPVEAQAVFQGTAPIPIPSNQPQAVVTTGSGEGNVANRGFPSAQDVLNVIALKCFQSVDPSSPEQLNGYLQYMRDVRKVLLVGAQLGSLIITVECTSLQNLEALWEDYCTGYLNEMAQKFLTTEDILMEFGSIEVKLTTTIMEEEYKACREYFMKRSGRCDRI